MHRGGTLSLENHRKLMKWAIACYEHVLPYYDRELDQVLLDAMHCASEWSRGTCSTGDAIKASRNVHVFARTLPDPVARSVARAIGHGVATAHMADHCLGPALYGQKAVILAGNSASVEKARQIGKLFADLPDDIAQLVHHTMQVKGKGLGIPDDT